MDSPAATSLFSALTFIIIFVSSVSTAQTNITAEPGQNPSLPCRSPDSKPVLVLEWIRPDLGSEYVLLYRNRKINTENQHPSFKDRVDLLDRQMKDGNVSLVLRNVTPDDRGAYECQVVQTETNSRRMTVVIINLNVQSLPGDADGGKRDGSGRVVLVVVPLAIGIIIIAAVGCFICKKYRSQKSNQRSEEPPQSQQPLTDQNRPADQ